MYQHGRRTRQPRNAGVFLATIGVVAAAIIVGWWVVHTDIGGSTGAKSTVPIVTEVGEDKNEKVVVNKSLFSFELPIDWEQESESVEADKHFYIWHSTKQGADDRRLTLHVDIMPGSPKLVRLQPLSPNDKRFVLGNLSDTCVNFAGSAEARAAIASNAPFAARWENVPFLCDPIVANQTIGTGSVDGGIATRLGAHNYFFFYEDHNVRPDDKILMDVLRSFTVK